MAGSLIKREECRERVGNSQKLENKRMEKEKNSLLYKEYMMQTLGK